MHEHVLRRVTQATRNAVRELVESCRPLVADAETDERARDVVVTFCAMTTARLVLALSVQGETLDSFIEKLRIHHAALCGKLAYQQLKANDG